MKIHNNAYSPSFCLNLSVEAKHANYRGKQMISTQEITTLKEKALSRGGQYDILNLSVSSIKCLTNSIKGTFKEFYSISGNLIKKDGISTPVNLDVQWLNPKSDFRANSPYIVLDKYLEKIPKAKKVESLNILSDD